jgi:hypothetical protein
VVDPVIVLVAAAVFLETAAAGGFDRSAPLVALRVHVDGVVLFIFVRWWLPAGFGASSPVLVDVCGMRWPTQTGRRRCGWRAAVRSAAGAVAAMRTEPTVGDSPERVDRLAQRA